MDFTLKVNDRIIKYFFLLCYIKEERFKVVFVKCLTVQKTNMRKYVRVV